MTLCIKCGKQMNLMMLTTAEDLCRSDAASAFLSLSSLHRFWQLSQLTVRLIVDITRVQVVRSYDTHEILGSGNQLTSKKKEEEEGDISYLSEAL